MSRYRRWRQAVATVLAAGFITMSAAAAEGRTRVYVRVGPPAPVVEVRAGSPGRGRVWVAGYHRWNGHAYVWSPGRWAVPPHARAVWVAPRWVHDRRHGWYFVAGHWR
jgi:hypothetical protein